MMNKERLDDMFKELLHEIAIETIKGNTAKFVKDVYAWYRAHKFTITPNQEKCIKRIYTDFMEG